MKKFGFTLSEILITVGIVGVVAALTAPAVSNIMPDRNKMMFMKNYKELTTITEKLLQDPELYYTTYTLDADGKKVPTCVGLSCYNAPLREPFKSASDCADKGISQTRYPSHGMVDGCGVARAWQWKIPCGRDRLWFYRNMEITRTRFSDASSRDKRLHGRGRRADIAVV